MQKQNEAPQDFRLRNYASNNHSSREFTLRGILPWRSTIYGHTSIYQNRQSVLVSCSHVHLYESVRWTCLSSSKNKRFNYNNRIPYIHIYHIPWSAILKYIVFTRILFLFMILLQKLIHSYPLQSVCSQILSSLALKVSKDRFLPLPQEYYFTTQSICQKTFSKTPPKFLFSQFSYTIQYCSILVCRIFKWYTQALSFP